MVSGDNDIACFPPEYFETFFKLEGEVNVLPPSYSIITAYATTGEIWSAKENSGADFRLAAELDKAGIPKWRITGYSPTTGHAEPGWATTLEVEEACELGRRFLQHAIFIVQDGMLKVKLCDGDGVAVIGLMSERLKTC